tara:strand:- start:1422 stop:1658 length:237 start_codon:yes stop_codon:yes gene_type:complete
LAFCIYWLEDGDHSSQFSTFCVTLLNSESGAASLILLPSLSLAMNENAELQNGRWAMIGIIALIGFYAFTDQIIPGFF